MPRESSKRRCASTYFASAAKYNLKTPEPKADKREEITKSCGFFPFYTRQNLQRSDFTTGGPLVLLRVALDPVGDFRQTADAVLGLAGAGELMVFSPEVAQPGGNAPVHQGGVHLHSLSHGAPVILVRVDKEGGGHGGLGVAQGRVSPQLLRAVEGVAVALVRGEAVANVGHAVEAEPVGDGALGGGAGEPVCVSNDPVGHKSAIGAASDSQPLPVDLRIPGQDCVSEVHEVAVVRLSIVATDVRKPVAPAVGAYGVAEEDKVTPVGPELHLVVKHRPVDGFGAAVDIQNSGIGFAGVKVYRFKNNCECG